MEIFLLVERVGDQSGVRDHWSVTGHRLLVNMNRSFLIQCNYHFSGILPVNASLPVNARLIDLY